MSPEQLREARHVDQRADIWGLGVILYELIAGRPPFDGSVTVVTAAIIADKPPPLSSLCPIAPPALDAVLLKALEKDPDKRWRDAEELAEALVPFASPEAVKRLRASLMQPTATPRSFRARSNVPSADDDPTATMARPSALPPISDTRSSFSAPELARAIRPRSRWRSRLIVAVGVLVPIAVVVAVAVRGSATPAPVAASATVTAVDAAEPSAAPHTIAAPNTSGDGEPTASANVVTMPAATAVTAASPSAPLTKRSSAGASHAAPAAAPAATKNPLHL
jgi:hypothetical protein